MDPTNPDAPAGPRRPTWSHRLGVAFAIAAVVVLAASLWDREAWAGWIASARPIPFFAAMALLPAIGMPMTPFFLVAGATFGSRLGLVGSAVALGANLALCYAIARSGLRPRLVSLVRRFGRELPELPSGRRRILRFTLLVKLAPGVPAFVKNYGLGIAGVPFALYFVTSIVFTGTYAVALVVLGDSLLEHDLVRTGAVGGAVVAFAVGIGFWARRRARRGPRGHDGDARATRRPS